jgi:hypothetical protein
MRACISSSLIVFVFFGSDYRDFPGPVQWRNAASGSICGVES